MIPLASVFLPVRLKTLPHVSYDLHATTAFPLITTLTYYTFRAFSFKLQCVSLYSPRKHVTHSRDGCLSRFGEGAPMTRPSR